MSKTTWCAVFNINDKVKVKLTPYGEEIHYKHFSIFKGWLPEHMKKLISLEPEKDEDGYTTYQLWELMNIFGSEMHMGADQVFENNIILLEGETDGEV